jgi:hypothetical protein
LNKGVKIILKFFIWVAGSIVFLLLFIYLLIQVASAQDYVCNKAVSFLQNKLKTKVEIQKLSIALPKQIVLRGVYFEDQKRDTLLAGEVLKIDISLVKLLKN